MASDTSKAIAKAVKKVEELSLDKDARREYEMRMKALSDYNSVIYDAKAEGIKEGIEKGIEKGIEEGIKKTKYDNLAIIPSTLNLAGVDVEFVKKMLEDKDFHQNEQLKMQLNKVRHIFDYIIIDCQPSLGLGTMNALVASDSVIIPVQCEFFALDGITQLLNSIIMVQSSMNPNLRIEGVLLTMLDGRTNIGLEVIEEIRKYFKDKVFNTIIPRLVRLVEAPSHGKPINEYDPTSRATEAYRNLAKEVISRNGD